MITAELIPQSDSLTVRFEESRAVLAALRNALQRAVTRSEILRRENQWLREQLQEVMAEGSL
jgi:hypothetical protein